jgi:hypothetical protein
MEKKSSNLKKCGLQRVKISVGTIFNTNVARLDHDKTNGSGLQNGQLIFEYNFVKGGLPVPNSYYSQ